MYYLYLFKLLIIGLTPLIIINYVIYKLIIEIDRINYIKDYEKRMNPLTQISRVVYNVVVFVAYCILWSLLISRFIINLNVAYCILWSFLIVCYLYSKVQRKNLKIAMSGVIVIPLTGILLPYFVLGHIQTIFMNHNYGALYNLISYVRELHLYTSVPFYCILSWKMLKKAVAFQNQAVYDYVKRTRGIEELEKPYSKRRLWIMVHKEEEFSNDYLVCYQDVNEWKRDSNNIIMYGLLFKLIAIFSGAIVLITCISLAAIYYDLFDVPYPLSPTNFQVIVDSFWGDQFVYFYLCFSLVSLIVVVGLLFTYTLNGRVALLFKKKNSYDDYTYKFKGVAKRENKSNPKVRIIIQVIIFICTIQGMVVVQLVQTLYGDHHFLNSDYAMQEYQKLVTIDFDESKKRSIEAIENIYDFTNYSDAQKYMYIMYNPQKLKDDVEELGFTKYEELGEMTPPDYNIYGNHLYLRLPFTEEFRKVYPYPSQDTSKYYYKKDEIKNEINGEATIIIGIYGFSIDFAAHNIPGYGEDLFYFKYKDEEYNQSEEWSYTKEEQELFDLMYDRVYKTMETLFAMEMEDEGIEL